jgi:hypothetical protein
MREKHAYKIFFRKPEGRRTLGKPRRRRKYNVKLILNRVGRRGLHFCGSSLEQVAGFWEPCKETLGSIK